METRERIAIIGGGLMGHGIAQVFACHGHQVSLMDLKEDILLSARDRITNNLSRMAEKKIKFREDINTIIQRIQTTSIMEEAVFKADVVVEAVAENLSLKQDIFQKLDRLCPDQTILATNTSVISISEIAAKADVKERIVGTHFWNPPYLVPLVEVVKGKDTSDLTMNKTVDLLKRAGKHPVKVMKDVPGFVGNRMQHALWREAISIVENGIADAQTVDECVKFGFGLRLPVLGPLENADMVGTDLTLAIHDYILKHIERSQAPSPYLREMVEKGDLGCKSGCGFQSWTKAETEALHQMVQNHLLSIKNT